MMNRYNASFLSPPPFNVLMWVSIYVMHAAIPSILLFLSLSRCSILACSAYVALALGDNLMALNHAEKLLQQPKLSGSLK